MTVVEKVEAAEFRTRQECITCGSKRMKVLSEGKYTDDPLHGFIAKDPFGTDPLPHLQEANWRFVQCEDCGQKFHQQILNDKWNGIYYDEWISGASIEELKRSFGKAGFTHKFEVGRHAVERILQIERLTRTLRGDDPVRVLDFGCGDGEFLSTCANFGFECIGVEFSAARDDTAVVDFYNNLDQVSENYALGSFHAIVLFEVLEHLTEPRDILQELRKYAAKGGILILETPNCPDVTDIKTERDYRLINPLGHINAFTAETQARIAQEAGFKRITPSVVQCTADPARAYKREVRRLLQPLIKRTTRQYFVAE